MDSSGTLTVKEVAAFLRVTPQAVYNLIKREEIAAFKVGSAVRVLHADLSDYVSRSKRLYAAQNADFDAPAEGTVAARSICAHFGGGDDESAFFLDSVDFEIPEKSTLGIIGPSGSGKTLLLKTLAGLVPLDGGALFIGKRRLDGLDARERHIGLVFQDYALYPTMDGKGNIAFPLTIGKEPKGTIDPTVQRIAADLGIEKDYLGKHIDTLPEGIKQLIAIGRAENKPPARPVELFLMDEPLIHLDARMRETTRAFLKSLVAAFGATTVYAFNEAADALALSDRLLVLDAGRLVQFGFTEAVFRRPASAAIMEILSLNGVVSVEGEYAEGTVDLGEYGSVPALLPEGFEVSYRGPVHLCFRPEETEALAPNTAGADAAGGLGILRAAIERETPYDGERTLAAGALLPATGKTDVSDEAPRVRFLAPVREEEAGAAEGGSEGGSEGAASVAAFRVVFACAFPA